MKHALRGESLKGTTNWFVFILHINVHVQNQMNYKSNVITPCVRCVPVNFYNYQTYPHVLDIEIVCLSHQISIF